MTTLPAWTTTHFPAAMRSLSPSVRAKAIEIANQLLAQGCPDKQAAITVSVDEARRWARLGNVRSESSGLHSRPNA